MKPLEPKPPDPPPPQRKEELPEIVLDFVPSQHFRDQDSSSCLRSTFGLCYNSQNRFLTNRCRSFTVLTLAGTVVSFQPSSAQLYFIEDSPVCSLLLSRIWHSHPPCIIGIQISPLLLSSLCVLVYVEVLRTSLPRIGSISVIIWFNLWNNAFCLCMRCSPRSYVATLYVASHKLIIDLVLLGILISDMIEDVCCTWVVWVLWVLVANFAPSDVYFLVFGVRALCLTPLSDSGTISSFNLVSMALPLWVAVHRIFALLCLDYGSFEKIRDISLLHHVESPLLCWNYVDFSTRWWVVLGCWWVDGGSCFDRRWMFPCRCTDLPFVFTSLIPCLSSLTCEGEWYGPCLSKPTIIDLSMRLYCQNNVPSLFCNNAMNWFLIYACCFWFAGCAFLADVRLHNYPMLLTFSGLLKHKSCLFSIVRMVSNIPDVFWLVLLLFFMNSTALSIIWNYSCLFSEIGLHCVHNSLLGCWVQYNVASFSGEQLVLCTPCLRVMYLTWSLMILLNFETFLADFLWLSVWLPCLSHGSGSEHYGIELVLLLHFSCLPSGFVILSGFFVMFWFCCPLCAKVISETDVSVCFLLGIWFVVYGKVTLFFTDSVHWTWVHLPGDLSMVSGHEESLWPKPSPLNSLCGLVTALAKSLGFPRDIEPVFCCCFSFCRTVLQKLKSCWHLIHSWTWTPLVSIFRNLCWLYLLHPWLGLSLQLSKWPWKDEASLYLMLIFSEWFVHYVVEGSVVTSPIPCISLPFIEVANVQPGPHMLQRTLPLCILLILCRKCYIVFYLWHHLDCDNRFYLFARNPRLGLYVISRFISAFVSLLQHVLSTVGTRYDMPSSFLLLSRSMVSGHKAQVLWPVASPLTSFYGTYYRCSMTNILWAIHFHCWYGCHDVFNLFPWDRSVCLHFIMLNLPARLCIQLRPVKVSLTDTPLQRMGLSDSFELLRTIFGQILPLFYL